MIINTIKIIIINNSNNNKSDSEEYYRYCKNQLYSNQ